MEGRSSQRAAAAADEAQGGRVTLRVVFVGPGQQNLENQSAVNLQAPEETSGRDEAKEMYYHTLS